MTGQTALAGPRAAYPAAVPRAGRRHPGEPPGLSASVTG